VVELPSATIGVVVESIVLIVMIQDLIEREEWQRRKKIYASTEAPIP